MPEIICLGKVMEQQEQWGNEQNTSIITEHKKIPENGCFVVLKKKGVNT